MSLKTKPGRPFGVTIAIFLSVLMYTILPLMEVVYLLVVNQLIYHDSETGAIIGFDLLASAGSPIFVQSFIALAFLLVAIFAWRGTYPQIRNIYIATVVGLTIAFIILQIIPYLFVQPNIEEGINSTDVIKQQGRLFQLILLLLIMLYVVWYMNRWAAKAFYRGFYIESDAEHLRALGVNPAEFITQSAEKADIPA